MVHFEIDSLEVQTINSYLDSLLLIIISILLIMFLVYDIFLFILEKYLLHKTAKFPCHYHVEIYSSFCEINIDCEIIY